MMLARPERFELPTPWFVAKYSIQLSYGREGADYSRSGYRMAVEISLPWTSSASTERPFPRMYTGLQSAGSRTDHPRGGGLGTLSKKIQGVP